MGLCHQSSLKSFLNRRESLLSPKRSDPCGLIQFKQHYLKRYGWFGYLWAEFKAFFGFTLSRDKRDFVDRLNPPLNSDRFYQDYALVLSQQSYPSKQLSRYSLSNSGVIDKLVHWIKSTGGRFHKAYFMSYRNELDNQRLAKEITTRWALNNQKSLTVVDQKTDEQDTSLYDEYSINQSHL